MNVLARPQCAHFLQNLLFDKLDIVGRRICVRAQSDANLEPDLDVRRPVEAHHDVFAVNAVQGGFYAAESN